MNTRPSSAEYAPYYAQYIDKVPAGDIRDILDAQNRQTQALLAELSETQGNFRYAPGKWSLKQVLGHLCDTERVFAYRALVFARNDRSPLPSMEQDDYVSNANFEARPLRSVADEFASIRAATSSLFRSVDDEMWSRRGIANNVEFTVRAMPFIIAGHELHHMGVVRARYLGG